MRNPFAMPGLVLAVAALLAASGCGGSDSPHAKSPSLGRFVSLTTSGINVDYTPLASPRDATTKADLIVEGTLVGVVDGIGLKFPDPHYTERKANSYATFVVAVEQLLSGDPSKVVNGRVYVTVQKSRAAEIGLLADANPRPRIVAVLDDTTAWSPSRDVTVTRPAAVPPTAPLYAAYTDGLWLQAPGDGEMSGLHVRPAELTPAWGGPKTLTQLSAAIRAAKP